MSTNNAEPSKLSIKFGGSADVNDIPETISTSTGAASISRLFPQATEIPLDAGGVAPTRADLNGLFKILGDNVYFLQHGGVYSYDSAFTYDRGAVVLYNGSVYLSLQDDNTGNTPGTAAAYWVQFYTSGNLVLNTASTTVTGITRLATVSEAKAGSSESIAVTPKGLVSYTSDALAQYVTLNTNQTVAGTKAFATISASKALTAPTVASTANDSNVATTAWVKNMLPTYGGVPAGTIIAWAANSVPSGFLLCNGATVSRTTYANLYAAIGGTYGNGDGYSTFSLPNLNDRFLQGTSGNAAYINPGLPNITGWYERVQLRDNSVWGSSGALYTAIDYWSSYGDSGSYRSVRLGFDASRSNGIYGSSSTVQPLSLKLHFCIKY